MYKTGQIFRGYSTSTNNGWPYYVRIQSMDVHTVPGELLLTRIWMDGEGNWSGDAYHSVLPSTLKKYFYLVQESELSPKELFLLNYYSLG